VKPSIIVKSVAVQFDATNYLKAALFLTAPLPGFSNPTFCALSLYSVEKCPAYS
jgi:hypothetical protein